MTFDLKKVSEEHEATFDIFGIETNKKATEIKQDDYTDSMNDSLDSYNADIVEVLRNSDKRNDRSGKSRRLLRIARSAKEARRMRCERTASPEIMMDDNPDYSLDDKRPTAYTEEQGEFDFYFDSIIPLSARRERLSIEISNLQKELGLPNSAKGHQDVGERIRMFNLIDCGIVNKEYEDSLRKWSKELESFLKVSGDMGSSVRDSIVQSFHRHRPNLDDIMKNSEPSNNENHANDEIHSPKGERIESGTSTVTSSEQSEGSTTPIHVKISLNRGTDLRELSPGEKTCEDSVESFERSFCRDGSAGAAPGEVNELKINQEKAYNSPIWARLDSEGPSAVLNFAQNSNIDGPTENNAGGDVASDSDNI